jgi:hypothetical protein
MNVAIYLPDEVGEWAKAQGVNFSRMLRDALEEHRTQVQAVEKLTERAEDFELFVETKYLTYTARLHATPLHEESNSGISAYLGQNQQIYVYNENTCELFEDVAIGDLHDWLPDDLYIEAMAALGETAIVDIGQAS